MEDEICWFCEKQPASPARTLNVELSRKVNQEWTGAQRTLTGIQEMPLVLPASVRIPRCDGCAETHRKARAVGWVLSVSLAFIAALAAIIYAGSRFSDSTDFATRLAVLVSVLCIWLVFFVIGNQLGCRLGEKIYLNERRSEKSVAWYLPVLELLAQGYTIRRTRSTKPSVLHDR